MTEEEYRRKHPEVLRFYDISADEYRDATQADVDLWVATANAYGRLRQLVKVAEESHQGVLEAAAKRIFTR